jgi:hypothetical protein
MTNDTTETKGPPPLEVRLADWRETAARLRHAGHAHDAELIEKVVDEVRDSSIEYLTFVNESDAMRRTGKSQRWLRDRFPEWHRTGNGQLSDRGQRLYRLCVLPFRPNLSAAREAGREAGRNPHRKSA